MDMGDDHTVQPPTLSTHIVDVSGPYGTVHWTVCKELWDILPVGQRIAALDVSGPRVIDPYFKGLAKRLLEQADKHSVSVDSLATDWSLEEIEQSCVYGTVIWQVSQGLWDNLPADSRENLIEFVKVLMHDFFHGDVFHPLLVFAYRKLHG